MKYGDKYLHFKNNEYFFQGIALPLKGSGLSESTIRRMTYMGTARYHENTHALKLYAIDGAMFIDSDIPHVIYQAKKDYNTEFVWAREVDDFFGYKNVDGVWVKKFQLIKTD